MPSVARQDRPNERLAPPLAGWTTNLAQTDGVVSVCLLGSHARGDAGDGSDIDLLVVAEEDGVVGSDLRDGLPGADLASLSLLVQSRDRFQALAEEGALFALHVRCEGVVLHDRAAWLERVLRDTRDIEPDPGWTLDWAREQLWAYRDPTRFNGIHLFAFSRLYSVGRAVGIAMTVADGAPLFGKDEVFDAVARRRPWLAEDARRISQLRGFRERAEGRRAIRLPFDYHSAEHEVRLAVEAVDALLADQQ